MKIIYSEDEFDLKVPFSNEVSKFISNNFDASVTWFFKDCRWDSIKKRHSTFFTSYKDEKCKNYSLNITIEYDKPEVKLSAICKPDDLLKY